MGNEKIRVLIVDDIAETREKLRELLQFESDVEVIGLGRTGNEAVRISKELNPDVILMDINMPDMDGIAATEAIRAKQPAVQVVILSIQSDRNYMMRAMLAGARDFLTKPPMGDELISAIRRAGEMALIEKSKFLQTSSITGSMNKEEIGPLLFKEKGLRLTLFDLTSRLDLYQDSITDGKLVDEVEVLVAGLAHDIRSPINIILSILDTVKSTEESTINAIKKIRRRSVHCKWVADNFLGISLSEKISIRDHVLRTSVDEVIALLESRIHPGIELVNNISDEIRIAVDPGLLTLILLNLISNSLESIPETGKISINVESLKNQTAIFVEDDGMTIPDQHVKQLFKLGFTTKESHVGIGLYVSNRLLKQQDGDLYFARDFRTNVKVFGVRLPTPRNTGTGLEDPNAIKQRIYLLQNSIENIKRELLQFRSQEITESQQGALSKEFQRMTSTFSKNLNNELLLIEATILDAINKLPTDDIATENAFRKIIRNCAYCRLLTSNILALGEGASPELEEISLIDIIEEVLLLVDRKMPPDLYKIEWDIDSLLPNIKADALQMKQVFMNLIKNALDAMSFGGALKIKLGVEESFVVAEVEDTGMGIDPINLPRLFQLGFTTKIKGYGIGLFSIKKIIERHNGKIEVSSVVDRGTAFKISLPFDPKEAK